MDDEAIITESLKRELRNEPHLRVEAAYSGEAALRLLEEIQPGRRRSRGSGDRRTDAGHEGPHAAPGSPENLSAYVRHPAHGVLRYRRHRPGRQRGRTVPLHPQALGAARPGDGRAPGGGALRPGSGAGDPSPQGGGAERGPDRSPGEQGPGLGPGFFATSNRVACYAALLGRRLGLAEADVRKLYTYAPLHDIGKAGIPHEILDKPGSLTPEEFAVVKRHVEIGTNLLKSIDVDGSAKDLILYHHERWDGKGYLAEMAGDRIPLSARITALADGLDAMLTKRPYKSDALPSTRWPRR
ncbi:MAG: HD domain-containing protein [Chromatiales bacterium]|nr:HD domain-containing protein [Chromatiales bacterium]